MKFAFATVGSAFYTRSRWDNSVQVRLWIFVALWALAIGGILTGSVYGITKGVRSAGAASCRTFSRQSGYSATYRIQHFLDAGTCYVRLPNGHALPQKMVTAYLKANK